MTQEEVIKRLEECKSDLRLVSVLSEYLGSQHSYVFLTALVQAQKIVLTRHGRR